MKRHYFLTFLLLTFMTNLSFAQITVKFKKPAGWTEVSLYTWGPDVLGSWPGTALTETDGWYTYTFDEAFTGANLIFNNAGSGEQTEDYRITASACLESVSTLNSNNKYNVTVVPCADDVITVKFKKPESWTSVNLYTYGPELLGGWPGAALAEADGWYVYEFDITAVGTTMIFSGQDKQVEDFVLQSDVCLEGVSSLNTNGKHDILAIPCNSGGIKVTFTKPESWTNVNLYAWFGPDETPTQPVGGWPGVALTEVDGVYSYTFDASITGVNVIFNTTGNQTESAYVTVNTCFTSNGGPLTVIDCTVGVDIIEAGELSIYPNPVDHNIIINSRENVKNVSVHSITGMKVLSFASLPKNTTLDMSSLRPGVYFINVDLESGKQLVQKIVKL